MGDRIQASLPSNAGSNADTNVHAKVVSVSCAAAGNCTAVGGYIDSSGLEQGLMLTETAGVWATGVEAILPAGTPSSASAFLNSVSCASAGDCGAVGYYGDFPTGLFHGVHRYHGLLLTETAGVWTPGLQASAPTTTGTNPRVVLSRLRVSPKKFVLAGRRAKGRCVKQTPRNRTHRRCIRSIELILRYQLNVPSSMAFTLKRQVRGRRVNARCVKPTHDNRKRRPCGRLIRVPGTITIRAAVGMDKFTFRGRIGGRRLGPGVYRLTATPQANGRVGTAKTIAFKIAA